MVNNSYLFEEYNRNLLKKFQKESKKYNEYFNNESLISWVKLKLKDKF